MLTTPETSQSAREFRIAKAHQIATTLRERQVNLIHLYRSARDADDTKTAAVASHCADMLANLISALDALV
jgi:hypothetical protein